MKAIVGIDSNDAYKRTLDLLAKLRFDKTQLTLLRATPAESPIACDDSHAEAEYLKVMQNLGLAALDSATDEACGRDLKAKTKLMFGSAANCMINESAAQKADLLAVCATHRGAWNTSYLGSTTCALAISSPVSLLAAKGPVRRSKDFCAVLASDHSLGSAQWIGRFIELAPQGITHLHVVSAYSVDDETALATHKNVAMLGGDVGRWLYESITEKTKAVSERLSAAGFHVSMSVMEGSAIDVIRQAMQSHHGELLVMGAHGNTQLPGSTIGSVALHELMVEQYPVLMVRA